MSADLNPAAEAKRLRQTITLAEEAIGLAADHRHRRHALGEMIEETTARWTEAHQIETTAKAARKAARKALADLKVFPDLRSPGQIAESIEAARSAALALKAACDAGQAAQISRAFRGAARDLKRGISEAAEAAAIRAASGSAGARGYMPNAEGCAEFAADEAAAAPAKRRKKGGSL